MYHTHTEIHTHTHTQKYICMNGDVLLGCKLNRTPFPVRALYTLFPH